MRNSFREGFVLRSLPGWGIAVFVHLVILFWLLQQAPNRHIDDRQEIRSDLILVRLPPVEQTGAQQAIDATSIAQAAPLYRKNLTSALSVDAKQSAGDHSDEIPLEPASTTQRAIPVTASGASASVFEGLPITETNERFDPEASSGFVEKNGGTKVMGANVPAFDMTAARASARAMVREEHKGAAALPLRQEEQDASTSERIQQQFERARRTNCLKPNESMNLLANVVLLAKDIVATAVNDSGCKW